MKTLKYICLALCAMVTFACSDDDAREAQRSEIQSSTEMGIYRDGQSWLAFDNDTHLYSCNPSAKTFTIMTDDGLNYTTLTLESLPTEAVKVDGKLTGNMGVEMEKITGIYLLKKDVRYIWLWSDDAGIGFVLPKFGIDK